MRGTYHIPLGVRDLPEFAIRGGMQSSDYDPFSIVWALFPSDMTDDDIKASCQAEGWRDEYNGPGRAFQHGPYIRRRGSRVLVTMRTGLDI